MTKLLGHSSGNFSRAVENPGIVRYRRYQWAEIVGTARAGSSAAEVLAPMSDSWGFICNQPGEGIHFRGGESLSKPG